MGSLAQGSLNGVFDALAFEVLHEMFTSSTIRRLEELGYLKWIRDLLIEQGTVKFGPPSEEQLATLNLSLIHI